MKKIILVFALLGLFSINTYSQQNNCVFGSASWFLNDGETGLEEDDIVAVGTEVLLVIEHSNCDLDDISNIQVIEEDDPGFDATVESLEDDGLSLSTSPGVIYAGWVTELQFIELGFSEYYFRVTPAGNVNAFESFVINVDRDNDEDGVPNALDDCPNSNAGEVVDDDGCATGDVDDSGENDFVANNGICEDGFIGDNRQGQDSGIDSGERYVPGINHDCRRCVTNDCCNDGVLRQCGAGKGDGLDFGEDELNCLDCAGSGIVNVDDSDGDGIVNGQDKCPYTSLANIDNIITTPPNSPYYGCNVDDKDEDGVPNAQDVCQGTFITGTVTEDDIDEEGCIETSADSDDDGIPNSNDECPDTPEGFVVNNLGCTSANDPDGDGIITGQDVCVNLGGDPAYINPIGHSHGGCPNYDWDGDGVNNLEDGCDNKYETSAVPWSPVLPNAEKCFEEGLDDTSSACPGGNLAVTIDSSTCSDVPATSTAIDNGAIASCSGSEIATSITINNFAGLGNNENDIIVRCCRLRAECV